MNYSELCGFGGTMFHSRKLYRIVQFTRPSYVKLRERFYKLQLDTNIVLCSFQRKITIRRIIIMTWENKIVWNNMYQNTVFSSQKFCFQHHGAAHTVDFCCSFMGETIPALQAESVPVWSIKHVCSSAVAGRKKIVHLRTKSVC